MIQTKSRDIQRRMKNVEKKSSKLKVRQTKQRKLHRTTHKAN